MSDVAPRLAAVPAAVALVGAGDPGSSRLVYAMVIGLAVVGVALVLLGVWLVRQTRPDLEVLAPLERMGDGDWRKRDPSTQRRMLDEVRPEGAEPLTPEPKPPPIDADFDADHPVASFSDLGPGVVHEARDPTPIDRDADHVGIWPREPDTVVDVPDSELEVEDAEVDVPDSELDAEDAEVDVGDSEPADGAAENVDDADDEALSDPRG